jgi:hypothetical protein
MAVVAKRIGLTGQGDKPDSKFRQQFFKRAAVAAGCTPEVGMHFDDRQELSMIRVQSPSAGENGGLKPLYVNHDRVGQDSLVATESVKRFDFDGNGHGLVRDERIGRAEATHAVEAGDMESGRTGLVGDGPLNNANPLL